MLFNRKLTVTTKITNSGIEKYCNEVDGKKRSYLNNKRSRPGCLKFIVRFLENTGFSNPYLHHLTCHAKHKMFVEQEKIIQNLFNDAEESAYEHDGAIQLFFSIRALPEHDRAIYIYSKLISKNR